MQRSIRLFLSCRVAVAPRCQRRPFSTSIGFGATGSCTDASDTAEIRYPNGKLRRVSRAWLRFNCPCGDCQNRGTHQRAATPAAALAGASSPARLSYPAADGGPRVRVDWGDGHASEFSFGQLDALLSPGESRAGRTLWHRSDSPLLGAQGTPAAARPVPLEDFLGSASGYRTVLRNLWTYGVATVTGVQPTEAATEAVVRRMAPVMETLFGRMWTFTADGSRQDTAYGCDALGVHNDTTYLHNCAGLQVFHVLQAAPSGGDTCLADGFQAAETLRYESPRHFALLTSRPVYHQYLETAPGAAALAHYMRCLDTVLKLDPEAGGWPYQVRYNPYDLASLSTLPQGEVAEFLGAHAHLGEILNRPESQTWLSLQPGTVLFLDNWRVLHGRSGFTGRRVVSGCYVTRDAWMSEARVHGVV